MPKRVFNKLQNTAETLKDVSCERNEFLVDEEKDMTHIGTPKARRLSLSKKRRKGTGRHGFAADRLKTDSSKGTWDLLKRERERVVCLCTYLKSNICCTYFVSYYKIQ